MTRPTSREQPRDLDREVGELRRQQHAIAQLGLLALREPSRQRVFQEVTSLVREAVGGDFSKIVELQPNGSLLMTAGVGWPDGVVGHLEMPAGRDSQAAYSFRQRAPVVTEDLRREDRFEPFPALLELGVISGVSVPIEGAKRAHGILEVDSSSPRAFSEDEVDFLQSAANILGSVIDRETQEQERELFFSAVTHELRGPLTSVLGFSHRLNRRLTEGTTVTAGTREELGLVEENALRMQRSISMLAELLRISGPSAPPEEEVPLGRLIQELLGETRELFPEIHFEEHVPAEEVVATANYHATRVALRNLIENAAKYSKLDNVVHVTLAPSESTAEVRVRDSCGGMAGHELDRVFEKYYRAESPRSARGLGLGLYLVERICSTFGWKLKVDNHPGEGCEFRVAIPLESGEPAVAR